MRNIIPGFTKEEKAIVKDLCDFSPSEEKLFNLRKNELSLEECAEMMHMSLKTVTRINKSMQNKIIKVTTKSPSYTFLP